MQELSESQRQELLKNPHIEKITDKFVNYTSTFKVKPVELYLEGQHPDKIFLDALIPIHFFLERIILAII